MRALTFLHANQRRWWQWLLAGVAVVLLLNGLWPPDMRRARDVSAVVTAADGTPLRTYLTSDGMLRWPATVAAADPAYVRLLIAYEDQRFRRHLGVDPLALGRALHQAIGAGHVVSGGSTITMQVARLLEPRPRTVSAKVIEMIRASQLELRYSKNEILSLYLTLAPFGGNIEGVEAASRLYFGKAPGALTLVEAATLVALPQSPSRLRADPVALLAARNKVLRIAGQRAGFSAQDIAQAQAEPVSVRVRRPPFLAAHAADRVRRSGTGVIRTTLSAPLQAALERKIPGWTRALDRQASLGVLVVRLHDRAVLAYAGSAGFNDADRAGQVDTVQAVRSPGSALKPFIYAMAFDRGLAHPQSLIDDVETLFGAYAPANFEDLYHGRVSAADALRLSLNVPAVLLLDRVGPIAFAEGLRRHGLPLDLPDGVAPGLPVALGGVGVRLDTLAAGYAALATDGVVRPLRLRAEVPIRAGSPLVGAQARAWVEAILRMAPAPDGSLSEAGAAQGLAVKTGTSYGYRDAWAIGWDREHLIAVWTGRPDGSPSPGHFGVATAAPILYDLFATLGVKPLRGLPDTGVAQRLPPALASLAPRGSLATGQVRVIYPVDGSTLVHRPGVPVPLDARGGRAPYTWLAGGAPLGQTQPGQTLMWAPDGLGFHDLAVVDASGRSARVRVRLTDRMLLAP
jgi:penicillin-binding protein 1C